MISPRTSSSVAAVINTVPSRVVIRPLVDRTVNVVPRLVEQRAAPAGNDCSGVALARPSKENEKAIGKQIPVKATPADSAKFDLTAWKDVERPPADF